jgi:hypothetical protein
MLERAPVGGDPPEPEKAVPRQPHPSASRQHPIEPRPISGMLRQVGGDGVEEDVDVDKNHL